MTCQPGGCWTCRMAGLQCCPFRAGVASLTMVNKEILEAAIDAHMERRVVEARLRAQRYMVPKPRTDGDPV